MAEIYTSITGTYNHLNNPQNLLIAALCIYIKSSRLNIYTHILIYTHIDTHINSAYSICTVYIFICMCHNVLEMRRITFMVQYILYIFLFCKMTDPHSLHMFSALFMYLRY